MDVPAPELFREVTVRVCGTLNLEGALQETFTYLRDVLPLDELRVNILDRDNQVIKVIAVVNPKCKDALKARVFKNFDEFDDAKTYLDNLNCKSGVVLSHKKRDCKVYQYHPCGAVVYQKVPRE